MIPSEVLCAYLDGELPTAEMERVRSAIAADAQLAERLAQLARVDRLVVEFSREIDAQPLPAKVQALLGALPGGAPAHGIAERAGTIFAFPRDRAGRRPAALLALAATLIATVVIGYRIGSTGQRTPELAEVVQVGPVAQATALHHALERVASGETYAASTAPGLSVTPVLSFASIRHEYCREFRAATRTQATRGLACRHDRQWETLKLAQVPAGGEDSDAYEAATADSDADFDAFVDGLIVDEALGADAEHALLEDQWRTP